MKKTSCLTVIIVRHGQTDASDTRPRTILGQMDSPLNDTGRKQVNALTWRLKKIPIDVIFTSDTQQSKETAQMIAKELPNVPIIDDDRLREMNMGKMTGKPAKLLHKALELKSQYNLTIGQTGECVKGFRKRVLDFYRCLLSRYVVSPQRLLDEQAKFLSLQSMSKLNQKNFSPVISIGQNFFRRKSGRKTSLQSMPSSPMEDKVFQYEKLTKLPSIESKSAEGIATKSVSTEKHLNLESRLLDKKTVLIITHGGWIDQLFRHLIVDLKFTSEKDLYHGFPKESALYKFEIYKETSGADYEFKGIVKEANDVSHWGYMKRKRRAFVRGEKKPLLPPIPTKIQHLKAEPKKTKIGAPKQKSLGW
ncbi:histidine phosphatase superfamily [Gorgonomyces haynaldii]|nr:histidine phosphatase superfamily [Gorgonomyces haynaldii]